MANMQTNSPESKDLTKEKSKKKLYLGLFWKLLIALMLLFSLIVAGVFYWFYTISESSALKRIQTDMQDTLQAAAKGINVDELLALDQEIPGDGSGFPDDQRFQNQLDWLDTVHKIEPRAWLYTYRAGSGEGEMIFLVDLYARYEPNRAAKYKESYISKGGMAKGVSAFTYRLDSNGKFNTYADKWGEWVSAYMPITNKKGEQVAAIGVDFRADYVNEVRQSIRSSALLGFAISYIIVILLVTYISRMFTRPIADLTRISQRISDGDYELDLSKLGSGLISDEIVKLKDVFSIMVNKIYQREKSLRIQVEKLKIEIDETRQKFQVNEIVDTDFFRDLRSKAGQLRKRRSDAEESNNTQTSTNSGVETDNKPE
jgi:methyl-accepting chemotaxis protein